MSVLDAIKIIFLGVLFFFNSYFYDFLFWYALYEKT